MAKVIFFFAGTGDDGQSYSQSIEDAFQHNFGDVIRVYIKRE